MSVVGGRGQTRAVDNALLAACLRRNGGVGERRRCAHPGAALDAAARTRGSRCAARHDVSSAFGVGDRRDGHGHSFFGGRAIRA